VRLRDFRVILGGLETCFQLTGETLGNLAKAKDLITRKTCWIQTFALTQEASSKEMKRRLMMLKALDHPNLLKMLCVLQDGSHLYAVYEATEGGTAEDLALSPGGISARWAAAIMRQVFAGLRHCHSQGLSIKSLSIQDIQFAEVPKEQSTSVKLFIDLDSAVKEVADQNQCMFSCGVVLSTLLTGKCALNKRKIATVSKDLASAYAKWQELSQEAKSFTSTLISNRNNKPSVEQCLQHPWIAVQGKPNLTPSLRGALRHLAKLTLATPLKKALIQFMLNFVLPSEDLKEAKQAFRELDTDMDGTVSEEELRVQFFRLFPEEQAKAALTALTSTALFSADRKLGYFEFLTCACDKQAFTSAFLIPAFQLLDKDKDGAVSLADLRDFLSLESEEGDPFLWQTLIASISGDTQDCFFYEDLYKFMFKQ
jgi:Ca2+-binding EF-hand superfamily protein